jgi:hypothetical protein
MWNKILKIYNSEKEINIKQLPNQFVLKTNHGSGFNIIVENKTEFNLTQAKTLLMNWLNIDYGKIGTEFHYSFINYFKIYLKVLDDNFYMNG